MMRKAAKNPGVGYGRPPVHSRFKKGQSGNPSGRKKRVRPLKSDFGDELSAVVQVVENGRPRRFTKQQLVIKALVTKAAKGDNVAIRGVIDLACRIYDVGPDDPSEGAPLNSDDREVLEAFLARRGGQGHEDQ
jgi:hypothetical protein